MSKYRLPVIPSSQITPREIYLNRRHLMATALSAGFMGVMPSWAAGLNFSSSPLSSDAPPTAFADITTYNNFYEFGTGKADPSQNAHTLTTDPWSVEIDGLVSHPQQIAMEDILKAFPLEERIYRLRCVEGWSMVIPWIGFPLAQLLKRAEPLGSARYVAFETLKRPEEMPGQRGFFQILDWPYKEGLRLDEAMHPLTIMAVGLYGETLPNQNGAPIRLVVPWKYGFKSIKSITRITLLEKQPSTTWELQNPQEYGFYANVNPAVDHPRWSQATERPIGQGGGLFARRQPTVIFNGYGEQVAQLYEEMDLRKFY